MERIKLKKLLQTQIFSRKMFTIAVLLLSIIVIFTYILYRIFFDINSLPIGKEIQRELSSDNQYVLIAYICETSLSSPAIRCEVTNTNTGRTRNIYWKYRQEYVDILWIDNSTVSINGIILNIFNDTYDSRHE